MNIGSRGATMAVDWEQRINFDRLRAYRLQRTKTALEGSELAALLLFDPNNLRYVTSTAIGTWERDKNIRFALVPRDGDPILWDFGSAARHHQLYCPWFPESSWRAWVPPMRGAMPDETGIPDDLAQMVHAELRERGIDGEPIGMDVPDMTTLLALQRAGLHIVDSQPVMLEARKIKSPDELALLDQAAGMVDAAYDTIYRMLRPGVKENEVVAAAMKVLFELGSEHVEAVNAISGERCNPHPHTFSDRLLRPGDQAFFDIIHSFMGYRTCYYRTFNIGYATPSQVDAYRRCREWLDNAIACVRPGATTSEIAEVWPAAQEFGMSDERAAFGLQFGHGLGVGLYEAPMISRLHSLQSPVTIEVGMVFALETYCAASDGRSAARIEEEVIVTPTGPQVITRFPAEELLVAGRNYVRGADFVREDASPAGDGVAQPAGREPAVVD
jgi:Xaa-Pro aminopeptidase